MKRALVLMLGGIGCLLGLTVSLDASPQQPKKGAAAAEELIEAIDIRGEPKPAAVKAIPGPKVAMGYENDRWQVQVRPGNADWTRVDGSIEVIGGEIARVRAVSFRMDRSRKTGTVSQSAAAGTVPLFRH